MELIFLSLSVCKIAIRNISILIVRIISPIVRRQPEERIPIRQSGKGT
jgi:hypothetical protein